MDIKTGKAFRTGVRLFLGSIDKGKEEVERPPWGAAAGVDIKTGKSRYNAAHERTDSKQVGCRPRARHGQAVRGRIGHSAASDGVVADRAVPALRLEDILSRRQGGG